MNLKILATEAGTPLALKVCNHLGRTLVPVRHKRFADGEYVPQIQRNIRDSHTVLISPTSPPTDRNLMDAAILGDAITRAAPARFTYVFPYLGYNRQDRKDRPRVPVTASLAADMISLLQPDNILMFDVHSEVTLGFFDRRIKVDHLYGSIVAVDRIREIVRDPFVVVGPDGSAGKRASIYSGLLGQGGIYALVDKGRGKDGKPDPKLSKVIGDVKGRDVIFIDDMYDTGGTAILAASTVKANGARKAYMFATHGLFSADAVKDLRKSKLDKVLVTDSVYNDPKVLGSKVEVLSIAPLLSDAINRLHEGRSLTELIQKP
jgi:ribose-phosphate pyrophosphokinase